MDPPPARGMTAGAAQDGHRLVIILAPVTHGGKILPQTRIGNRVHEAHLLYGLLYNQWTRRSTHLSESTPILWVERDFERFLSEKIPDVFRAKDGNLQQKNAERPQPTGFGAGSQVTEAGAENCRPVCDPQAGFSPCFSASMISPIRSGVTSS